MDKDSKLIAGIIIVVIGFYFVGGCVGLMIVTPEKKIAEAVLTPCLKQNYTREHCISEAMIELGVDK